MVEQEIEDAFRYEVVMLLEELEADYTFEEDNGTVLIVIEVADLLLKPLVDVTNLLNKIRKDHYILVHEENAGKLPKPISKWAYKYDSVEAINDVFQRVEADFSTDMSYDENSIRLCLLS